MGEVRDQLWVHRGHTAQLLWEGAGLLQELRGGGSADCQESQQGGGEGQHSRTIHIYQELSREEAIGEF